MRKLPVIIVLLFSASFAWAQEECAFKLQEAQDMFDAGLIETIPDALASCLDGGGFTKEEKLQAYKLIILSYIFDDNIEKADEFMLRFLKDYPAYEPVATDPREFILLMDSYDTSPVLMIGGKIGANFSFPFVLNSYGTHNQLIHKGHYVPGRSGVHGSLQFEKKVSPRIHLTGEVSFSNNVFDFYLDDERENIVPAAEITDFSVIEFYESQNRIQVPLGAYYTFKESGFMPYVRAGIMPGILVTDNAEGLRNYINTGDIRYDPVSIANLRLMPVRRIFNLWAFAGTGFTYKIGPGNAFLDLRVQLNLMNQVKPDANRYMNQDLTWAIYFVNDDFLLNNLALSAGYMFPIYRPKKKAE